MERSQLQQIGVNPDLSIIGDASIEEKSISLTLEQAIKSVELCQSLSDLQQDIILFRFDELKGEIYILAGLDIEIIIYSTGIWEFLPNET
jgi:hypothetical protein